MKKGIRDMVKEMIFSIPKKIMIIGLIQYLSIILFFCFVFVDIFIEYPDKIYLLIVSLIGLVISVYYILLIPYKININNRTITFITIIKTKTYLIHDITKIRSTHNGLTKFQYAKNKSIFVPSQFTDFYLLLSHLKDVNPEIENYGC